MRKLYNVCFSEADLIRLIRLSPSVFTFLLSEGKMTGNVQNVSCVTLCSILLSTDTWVGSVPQHMNGGYSECQHFTGLDTVWQHLYHEEWMVKGYASLHPS